MSKNSNKARNIANNSNIGNNQSNRPSSNNCDGNKNRNRNNRNRNNGGRGNQNRPKETTEPSLKPNKEGDINDVSMYIRDKEQLRSLTNISFTDYLGVPLDQFGIVNTNKHSYAAIVPYHVPGLAVYRLNQSPGLANPFNMQNQNSGINMASKSLFYKLSSGNMKTTSYGPEDVGMAMLAVSNLLEMQSHIRRIFGLLPIFNERNRYYPTRIIRALGVQAEEFKNHIADYRSRFNYILTLANRIPFPSNIPMFGKSSTMYDYIYVDEPNSALAQNIILVPATVWKFNDIYSEKGTGLSTIPLRYTNDLGSDKGLLTMGELLDIFADQVNALVNSTALEKVYSDILRLAKTGEMQLLKFASLLETYATVPVYSEEVCLMLHNATIPKYPLTAEQLTKISEGFKNSNPQYSHATKDNDVVGNADTHYIEYAPVFWCGLAMNESNYSLPTSAVIDFNKADVSPDEIFESTRFTAIPSKWDWDPNYETGLSDKGLALSMDVSIADHYIVACSCIMFDGGNHNYEGNNLSPISSTITISTSGADVPVVAKHAAFATQFRCAHFIYANCIMQPFAVETLIGDTQWYTTVDQGWINRLNDFAMIGLFDVV